MLLLVSKEKSVFLLVVTDGKLAIRSKYILIYANLQESVVHNFDKISISTTFLKIDSSFIPCRESSILAIFQNVAEWLSSFQNNMVHFQKNSLRL